MTSLTKEEATRFFSILFGGEHHIPGNVKEFGYGWSVNYGGDVATYDFSILTRLVVLAHEMCIRACVKSGGPGKIKIILHKRQRDGEKMWDRHPTLEENIQLIKAYRWPKDLTPSITDKSKLT